MQSELVRLKVSKVFVVGLSTTIVNAVKAALPSLGSSQIVALTGADKYQTAALVAGKVKELTVKTPERVFIVPGDVYGSSLAAVAVAAANGWPILLTPQAGPFPSYSAQAIASLGVTTGIEVDTNVNPGVSGFALEKTIMGTTSTSDDPGARYSESLAVADYAVQQGWTTDIHVALGEEEGGSVAYSVNFPDNVLLASHIAREDGAYLLAKSTGLLSAASDYLKQHGPDINSVDFMRPDYENVSSTAWSFAAVRQVKSLNSPRVTGLSKTSGPLAGGGALTVTGSGFNGATTVRMGKTDLPAGSWHVNSGTSFTIDSVPAATQAGAMEVLVSNYWYVNPSNPTDVYLYLAGNGQDPTAMQVVQEAIKYLGVPYVWAGASTSGFDCSGFTMYVYNKFTSLTGVTLPHHAAYQVSYGTAVSKDALVPGDLVFFGSPISHVGIYVGNGLMINAPRSGDLVCIEDVFRTDYNTARRLIAYTPPPPPPPPGATRYEQTNGNIVKTGTWENFAKSAASGGSYGRSSTSGASATIYFNGTQLDWMAMKGTTTGIADVYLDGTKVATINLAASSASYAVRVWSSGTLVAGDHYVKIVRSSSSASGKYVTLDAVDIVGTISAPPPPLKRYEQTDTHIVKVGTWENFAKTAASGGSYGRSSTNGASATIYFNGTRLDWIAMKGTTTGAGDVYVDGTKVATINLAASSASYQVMVWSTGTLVAGNHTVRLERVGTVTGYLTLDAVDIWGTITSGPL